MNQIKDGTTLEREGELLTVIKRIRARNHKKLKLMVSTKHHRNGGITIGGRMVELTQKAARKLQK